tara:strand:+ start:421 stop:1341 length:921 start_codon:yes stop_codon:yes gene_type:complete
MSNNKTDKGKHLNLFTSKPKTKRKVSDKAFDMMTTAADKTAVDLLKTGEIDKSTKSIHTALMAAGMTPAIGNVADLTDATLYALEGEFGNAAWSAAAAIPIIGQMVAGKRALKIAKESGEKMVTLYRGNKGWTRRSMVKNRKFVGPKVVGGHNVGVAHPSAKAESFFTTTDPYYASSRAGGGWNFKLFAEMDLKAAKKSKEYFNDVGLRIFPDTKQWKASEFRKYTSELENKIRDWDKHKKTIRGQITSGKFVRTKEMPHILEFEVPESWIKKFRSKTPEGAYSGTYLFDEGLPVYFLKNVHRSPA